MQNENYYVTHVVVAEPPKNGFDQLFYYTTKDKNLAEGGFYWGKGINAFTREFIEDLAKKKKILEIHTEEYPLLINEDESLWFDNTGTIYKADIQNPLINQKKICTLEALSRE